MRLMPKGLKNNNETAPLSVARERVRDSWKLLKQSLYHFSSNSKTKNINTDDKKAASAGGGGANLSYNLQLKNDEHSVEALVTQKVSSFLNDSEDYDGIAYLLGKYKHELQAFNKLKNNVSDEIASSDFSEISSISELSLSNDSDEDEHVQACSTLNHTKGQNRINDYLPTKFKVPRETCTSSSLNQDINSSTGYVSSTLSPNSTSSQRQSTSIISSTVTSDYSNKLSPSSSRSTVWTKITPSHQKIIGQPLRTSQLHALSKTSGESRVPPPERATAVFRPLPSLMKPCFIPDVSNFDREMSNGACCSRRSDNEDETQQNGDPLSENNCFSDEQCFNSLSNNEINTDNDDTVFYNNYAGDKISSNSKQEPYGLDIDERLHHTFPKYSTETHSEFMSRICSTSIKHSNESFTATIENNTSGSIENNNIILNSQNHFNSLPNMSLIKNRTSSEGMLRSRVSAEGGQNSRTSISGMSSYDSEYFLSKSSLGRSFDRTVEADTDKLTPPSLSTISTTKYDLMFDNEQHNGENVSPYGSLTMVDENYFIVYPETNTNKIMCGNPPCSKMQATDEGIKFTSCPSCYICYCSRTCRHCHWPDHKETCLVGFVNFYVHTFFRRCEKDCNINAYLKNLAYEAYQIFGRGCLVIPFESPSDVELDAISDDVILSTQPMYKDLKRILSENKSNRHLNMLCQNIKDYDPDQEFVLNIFVWIGKPNTGKKICTAVVRSARIAMLTSEVKDYGDSMLSYGIRKFSLPTSFHDDNEDMETRRFYCKEIAFGLKRYGVHLKSDYPEAYDKLYSYIDDEVMFAPIILYGKRNDRNFKCILYPGNMRQSQDNYGDGVFV